MNINYLLLSSESDVLNTEEIDEHIIRLLDIISNIVRWDDEQIFYSTTLFDSKINDQELGNWLFLGEESIEKQLLLRFLTQDCENDDTKFNQLYNSNEEDPIGGLSIFSDEILEKPNHIDMIRSIDDNKKIRINVLSKTTNSFDFVKGLEQTFNRLFISDNVYRSIRHFNPISKHVKELIRHLSIIDDFAMEFYNDYKKQGHTQALRLLGSKGIACSPEGDPERVKRFLTFEFIDIKNNQIKVECAPHSKLYRPDSDYRIYFEWNDGKLNGRPDILIGHIGSHPYP